MFPKWSREHTTGAFLFPFVFHFSQFLENACHAEKQHVPLILALGRQKQVGLFECVAILIYIVGSIPARTTQ